MNIELTNSKYFGSQTITFNERLNIIIGDNGSGKTTLLKVVYEEYFNPKYTDTFCCYYEPSRYNKMLLDIINISSSLLKLNIASNIKTVLEKLHEGNTEFEVYYKDGLIVSIDGSECTFNNLSDGYKNVLLLVMDITFRMSNQKTKGIILVDGLDVNLHPKWQKNIINALLTIFPNYQFIVTTHSPIICMGATYSNIFKLVRNKNITEIKEVIGLDKKRLVYGNILEALGTELFGNVAISEISEELKNEMSILFMKSIRGLSNKQEVLRLNELRGMLPTQNTIE